MKIDISTINPGQRWLVNEGLNTIVVEVIFVDSHVVHTKIIQIIHGTYNKNCDLKLSFDNEFWSYNLLVGQDKPD